MGIIKDTFMAKWTAYWLHVINNPKTSLQGALSFLAISALALTTVIPSGTKIYAAATAVAFGIPKLLIGFEQKDSGTVPVTTPQNPVPHSEPATEVPLNPEASIVVPTP